MRQIFEKQQLWIKKICLVLFLLLPFYLLNWSMAFSFFLLGYVIGFTLMFLDESYFYLLYQDSVTENDAEAVGKRTYPALITRNSLFLAALPILSFFVLSSTGSLPGIGLVLALNLVILVEFWQLRREPLLFAERFMASLARPLKRQEVNNFCYLATLYFLILLVIWL